MLSQVASGFDDKDGNFVEQFQSTAFDARLWELYLFAALTEWGFSFDVVEIAPGFIAAKAGRTVCFECVTVNRSQGESAAEADEGFEGMTRKERALQQWANHYPITESSLAKAARLTVVAGRRRGG